MLRLIKSTHEKACIGVLMVSGVVLIFFFLSFNTTRLRSNRTICKTRNLPDFYYHMLKSHCCDPDNHPNDPTRMPTIRDGQNIQMSRTRLEAVTKIAAQVDNAEGAPTS